MLTLAVKPSRIVKDIRISGEYPLFRSDVLKAMSVYVGDSLLPDTLAQQEELIRSLYRKEGYANPKVTVKEGDVLNGTVVIDVDIRPGDYYTLESVKISGNDAVTDAEILSRMSSWRQSFFIFASGRFLEADLAQDIKDIRDLYWQRGYPECEITYTVDRDEKDLAVSTAVTIVEGPLYDLSIKGNDHFWAYTLKQDVVMFEEGNRRDRGLRRSTQNMVDRYRAEGFLDVEVEALEEKETVRDRKRRALELVFAEGPRTLVESVVFAGATAISEEKAQGRHAARDLVLQGPGVRPGRPRRGHRGAQGPLPRGRLPPSRSRRRSPSPRQDRGNGDRPGRRGCRTVVTSLAASEGLRRSANARPWPPWDSGRAGHTGRSAS